MGSWVKMFHKSFSYHWIRLGFTYNPYHAGHLPVDSASKALFVGRRAELERLLTFIRSHPTGNTLVGGPTGIGKLSLVNMAQQQLYETGERFPLFEPIQPPVNATRESLLLTALSALVSSLRLAFCEKDLAMNESYRAARDTLTRAIQAMASAAFPTSFALQHFGQAAGDSKALTIHTPLGVTAPTLIELLRGLTSLAQERGLKGVILPVSNLNTLDSKQFIRFFNMMRDACSAVQSAHWIFIAGSGALRRLESEVRRVSETFTSDPIMLQPLAWSEVAEALERRRATFATHSQAVLPISERVAKLVYDAAGGELRFTFARLSCTVLEFSARFPSVLKIPDELALALLCEWGQGQLERHSLTTRERDVLQYVREHGVIRARDHAALGIQRSQQLSQLLRGLEEKEYLRVEEKGTARKYYLSRAASLAFLSTHSR